MFNMTKVGAWAGAMLAVLALCAAGLSGAKWLIAQEYAKQMAPVQEQLDEIIQQNRVDSDRESLIFCLEWKHQDETAEVRKELCEKESAERWAEWKRQDDAKKKPE